MICNCDCKKEHRLSNKEFVNDPWSLFHLEGQNYLTELQDIFMLTLEGKKK